MGSVSGRSRSVHAAPSSGAPVKLAEGEIAIFPPGSSFRIDYADGSRAFDAVEHVTVTGPGTYRPLRDGWVGRYERDMRGTKLIVSSISALVALVILSLHEHAGFMTVPGVMFCVMAAQLTWPKRPDEHANASLPATVPTPTTVLGTLHRISGK